MDCISKSSYARILNVTSVHHSRGQIKFDDINSERSYEPTDAYCQSKLANVLFTRELAKRLRSRVKYAHIKVYALHPGTVKSNLLRHVSGIQLILFNVIALLFNIDVLLGTQTTLYCALEDKLNCESGLYYRFHIKNFTLFL